MAQVELQYAGAVSKAGPAVEGKRPFARVYRDVVQADAAAIFDHRPHECRPDAVAALGRGDIDALEVAGQTHPHLGPGHAVDDGQPRHTHGFAIDLGQPSQMATAMLGEPFPESFCEFRLSHALLALGRTPLPTELSERCYVAGPGTAHVHRVDATNHSIAGRPGRQDRNGAATPDR